MEEKETLMESKKDGGQTELAKRKAVLEEALKEYQAEEDALLAKIEEKDRQIASLKKTHLFIIVVSSSLSAIIFGVSWYPYADYLISHKGDAEALGEGGYLLVLPIVIGVFLLALIAIVVIGAKKSKRMRKLQEAKADLKRDYERMGR